MSTLMQDRYGRAGTPRRRTLLLAAAGLALLVSLAFIAWVTVDQRPALNWDVVGFKVLSDAETEVTFDVGFSDTGSGSGAPSADCTVQTLNELRTEVGLQDVRVQAGPGGRVRATVTVPTSERATAGLVKTCTRTGR